MKKIAVINNGLLPLPPVLGGAVETLIQILVDINEKEQQIQFEIFSNDNAEARKKAQEYKFTNFHFVKTKSIPNRIIDYAKRCYNFIAIRIGLPFIGYSYASSLIKYVIKDKNIDCILLEGASMNANYIKRRTSLPIIQRVHNVPKHVLRHWDAVNAKSTDMYLGISKYICGVLQNDIEGKYGSDIHLLYNTIDFKQFNEKISNERKNILRRTLNIPNNSFLFIFTGRLRDYKGIKELLLAFFKSKDDIPNAYLLVVGSFTFSSSYVSPFEKELAQIIQQLGKRVIFTGFVNHDIIHHYYQIADVGVFPSTWEEPFALTCLEAIASSLPVIITKSGGMPEIVDDECGIIVKNDDNLVDSLSSAMNNMYYMEKTTIQKMGNHSMLRAKCFDNVSQYKKFLDYVYSKV